MYLSTSNGVLLEMYDTIGETVEHLSKAGFTHMDVSFFSSFMPGSPYFTDAYKDAIRDYKEAFARFNMTPVQCHEPAGNLLGEDGGAFYMKKTPRSIEMAAKIGCPSITIHPGTPLTPMTREEFVEKNIEFFKKLLPTAERYGIELLLENIGFKYPIDPHFTTTAEDLNVIIDEIGHPLFKANWDVGHAHTNGLSQYDEVKRLDSRLRGIHVHDNAGFTRFEENGRIARGDMHLAPTLFSADFDGLIRGLIETEYEGTFNFEVDRPNCLVRYIKGQPELIEQVRTARLAYDTYTYAVGRLMLSKFGIFEG